MEKVQKVHLTYKFRLYPMKVDPRGTSEGLSYEDPLRDWTSACRILMRGWGSPDSPAEMKPLRELIHVPASLIVEAGSPHPLGVG